MFPQEMWWRPVPFTWVMRRKLIKKNLLELYAIFLFFLQKSLPSVGCFPVLFFFVFFQRQKYEICGRTAPSSGPCHPGGLCWGAFAFPFPRSRRQGPRTRACLAGAAAASSHALGMGSNANGRLQSLQSVLKALCRNLVHDFSTAWGEFRILKNPLIDLIVLKTILITFQLKASFTNVPHLRTRLIISAAHLWIVDRALQQWSFFQRKLFPLWVIHPSDSHEVS